MSGQLLRWRRAVAERTRRRYDDRGAGFVEYAGLLLLIATVVSAVMLLDLDTQIGNFIQDTGRRRLQLGRLIRGADRERGAVFPLYIWMVTGLLVIAVTLFVFARAAVLRSSGQSAADAAALAAATEARDQLYGDFLDAVDGDDDLGDILAGEDLDVPEACGVAAPRLADLNDAVLEDCDETGGRAGYTVWVTTNGALGDTVIPGVDADQRWNGSATAVIRGLCEVEDEGAAEVELNCEEGDLTFDPGDEDELPEARELFQVYLED